MQIEQTIFPIPSNQLPIEAKTLRPQAFCQLFIRKSVPSSQKAIALEDQQYQNYQVFLTTSGDYVFDGGSFSKEIKSGFKCDFSVKFWMIRSPSLVHFVQSQIANTVGKVKGISFQFPKKSQISTEQPQSQTISLFLDEQCSNDKIKNLQNFASVLERKFIVQKQFHQKYKAIKRIGKGLTACVYSSLCLIDKSQVAIKSFKKEVYFNQDNGNGKKGFLKEFKILTQINCIYLSKLLGVYESDHSIYIVQQLLDRTLHNYLQKFGFPDTTQTRRLLYQLLIGLRYLHRKNIMHRDIKLQNILIRGAGKDNITPVIVDFGLAEYEDSKQFVYTRCGTPGYVAPEVLNANKEQKNGMKYNKSCDIFSLGVIFHILLLGKTVFQGEDLHQVVLKNKLCMIDYEFKSFVFVSPEIVDLLTKMLHRNPDKRYTVDQLMDHVFFVEEKAYFSREVDDIDRENFIQDKISEEEIVIKEE